jgi:hypothetical protein
MEQTHKRCRRFGLNQCPHIQDDVMIRATQETPRFYGKVQQLLPPPSREEIDGICNRCSEFIQK